MARRARERAALFTWEASARALIACFDELEHDREQQAGDHQECVKPAHGWTAASCDGRELSGCSASDNIRDIAIRNRRAHHQLAFSSR